MQARSRSRTSAVRRCCSRSPAGGSSPIRRSIRRAARTTSVWARLDQDARSRHRGQRSRHRRCGPPHPRPPRRQPRRGSAAASSLRPAPWSRRPRGPAASRRAVGTCAGSTRGRPHPRGEAGQPRSTHRHPVPPWTAAQPADRRRCGRLLARVGRPATGVLWISGDTVLYDGVRDVRRAAGREHRDAPPRRGAVRRHRTRPLHDGRRAGPRAVRRPPPAHVVPVHYEGWSHFHEGHDGIEAALEAAEPAVRDAFRVVTIGEPVELDV